MSTPPRSVRRSLGAAYRTRLEGFSGAIRDLHYEIEQTIARAHRCGRLRFARYGCKQRFRLDCRSRYGHVPVPREQGGLFIASTIGTAPSFSRQVHSAAGLKA